MTDRASVCMDCGEALSPRCPGVLCARCMWMGEDAPPAERAEGVSAMRVPGHDVLEEIARGGMGVVYRARERESHRTVALKMLRPRLADEEGMRERFRQEARAVAALEHPGILPVYRVDETDDLPFFTMKLASGGTLAQRRADYTGKWRDIAALMISLCDAVQYAHQHGVLHRDLKPHNVLFDDAGKVYLADFGLAKLVDSVSELTGSLTFLGTPHYSAPEVASQNAAAATVASDVWSLGAVLYELLAGRLPFHAEGVPALLRKIVEDDAPGLPAAVPRDLAVICLKCLSKSEPARYGSAGALAADLLAWRDGRPIAARPLSRAGKLWTWMRRNPLPAALAAALLTASVIAVAAVARESRASRAAQHTSEDNARAARLQEATALLAEARAKRMSGSFPDRDSGIAAARRAWALQHSPEARDEILSLLALPGVRPAGDPIPNGVFRGWNARADDNFLRYVILTPQGCSIRDMATRAETGFIADLPVDDNTGRFPPGPLSLDGQLLSIRKPGATVLWNVEHRAPVLTLPQLWGAHSFSDDGRWFLAGTVQGIPLHPRLCDLSTTPPDVREYTALPPGWTAYNLSPDGRYFVAGGVTESGLRLVDTATLATVTDYHYPADFRLRGMVWNASSQFFLSCSNTGHIACWYPRKPDPAWILPAHTGDVYPPALFNNDTGMATTGSDGLIKFWNLTTHQAAGSLPLRALALHASRDGTRLLADDPDHRQRPLFECTPSTVAAILKLPADPVRNVYTPGTPWLAALAGGGFAVTGGFDLHSTGADGDSLAPALVSPQNDAAALDEAGRRFFRRTGTRLTVMPLPVAPGPANFLAQARRALRGLGLPIAAPADSSATPPSWPVALGSTLAFDPLSRRLLTGGSDGLALWQFPPTGLLSTPVPLAAAGLEPKASVTALRWSPRGHYLAWSGTRPALDDPKKKRRGTWLVDTASGRETGALFGDAPVTALLFTPDETLLIAATPGEIRCAATATGALRWSHPHHRPAATPPAMAVAENAPLAAITLEPETIALLDPATGTIRYRLTHPVTRTVRTLAFNADATRLAAIAGNFLQTWKLDTIARILHEQGME